MNLQQLEYIVALAKLQHFGKAADFCNISQPTLTMMVQKLEQEYDIRIFNRTRPISLTPLGEKLIGQAEIILKELGVFKDFIQEEKKHVAGYFNLGIIPTVASYILPFFLVNFSKNHPQLHLNIEENTTDVLIEKLKKGLLDGLVISDFDRQEQLHAEELYREKLFFYKHLPTKLPSHTHENLWLLKEGHCLRTQALDLCKNYYIKNPKIQYQSGHLSTLKLMVDLYGGTTVLPETALYGLSEIDQQKIQFNPPTDIKRTVYFVSLKDPVKKRIQAALVAEFQVAVLPLLNF